MHGIEHRVQERRTFRLSAPLPPFSFHRQDQSFLARRSLFLLSSTGPVARNGLSLACNGFRPREFHSRVSVPGLLLRFLHGCSQARSACAPPPLRLRRCGGFLASARCLFASALDRPPAGLHSPLGTLAPSGSKRSTGFAADQSTFRIRPISAGSPLPLPLLAAETDHRSWSATFPEAGCFLKPLGTFFTMRRKSCAINENLQPLTAFPRVFTTFKSAACGRATLKLL